MSLDDCRGKRTLRHPLAAGAAMRVFPSGSSLLIPSLLALLLAPGALCAQAPSQAVAAAPAAPRALELQDYYRIEMATNPSPSFARTSSNRRIVARAKSGSRRQTCRHRRCVSATPPSARRIHDGARMALSSLSRRGAAPSRFAIPGAKKAPSGFCAWTPLREKHFRSRA